MNSEHSLLRQMAIWLKVFFWTKKWSDKLSELILHLNLSISCSTKNLNHIYITSLHEEPETQFINNATKKHTGVPLEWSFRAQLRKLLTLSIGSSRCLGTVWVSGTYALKHFPSLLSNSLIASSVLPTFNRISIKFQIPWECKLRAEFK